ncbi:oxidoreductase-like protein [Coniochaeta ligniaria NRRL 30616]|uniref:Oxidoreductase-like protein n=1 Tax=Coniochaeta ligniaria NRRL 30616 TaxID=1408157 RepID=A0A1J7JDA7_9PEZI|nr:oxidoreductase-like protein [Coniochaeta ligniaria NRRL 30616]
MTSNPQFNDRTSGLEVAKTFGDQIRGNNVLITGVGPGGIGGATALAFASQQPKLLILASRTKEKLESVAKEIASSYPGVRVEIVKLDLSSQKDIREAADSVKQLADTLDILVNNAGLTIYERKLTPDGLELQFGTNHIGPFLFTNLLLPLLLKAAEKATPGATRIVSLTSAGHRLSPVRFSDYNLEGKPVPPEEDHVKPLFGAFARENNGYNGIVAYAQSKTGNILFTKYLQDHLGSHGIAAYALHPGSVVTELGRSQDDELEETFKKIIPYWGTPDEGSSTTMVAATDPALNEIKGLYLKDCQIQEPAPHASDPKLAERLWHLSEELVGQKFQLS